MNNRVVWGIGLTLMLVLSVWPQTASATTAESKRMERAKDLIADDQWVRAIDELKAAATDPKEPNKAEALFWLAHSQNQAHDSAAAVETIRRLEREFPSSRWVKPAQSLRIEIAQRLQRNDVLWYAATPPPPPARPVAVAPPANAPPTPPPTPFPAAPPAKPAPPWGAMAVPKPPAVAPPAAPMPPPAWVPEGYQPDTDQQIQALAFLIRIDATKVIPMLKSIALESDGVDARRALMVLAQSGRPEARETVVDVAKTGPERVRLMAVKELGRLAGPAIVDDLVQVYSTANEQMKYQVVSALGQRDAAPALLQIAKSEKDRRLRDTAIVTLGDAGGRQQLATLYLKAPSDAKRPIIVGLFNAQADDELIRIAERERDPAARAEVLARLRLLGTAKAKAYLAEHR